MSFREFGQLLRVKKITIDYFHYQSNKELWSSNRRGCALVIKKRQTLQKKAPLSVCLSPQFIQK